MRADRLDRNRVAESRLAAEVPAGFPRAVLAHAVGRRFVPPLPRLAIESYWRTHPLRADRLARALAARSGAPAGWRWGAAGQGAPFRAPPAPFREDAFRRGPGFCCVCGQPVYRYGWHRDLWGDGTPNRRAGWHACCVAAWRLWTAPAGEARLLRRLQGRRSRVGGGRLLRCAEVDHRVPLYLVWRDHRDEPWPDLLRFWGVPNLQVVNRPEHRAKCAAEAGERAALRRRAAPDGAAATPP